MRSPGARTFRLTFFLPAGARRLPSGLHRGWVRDCEIAVADRHVAILGPSKERVMDQAARLLRVACYGIAATSIASDLQSPPPNPGRDAWTIIVNADISFAPTGLGAVFPPEISDAAAAHLA